MSTPEAKMLGRVSDGVRTALGIGGLIAIVLGLLILFFPVKSGEVAMQIVAAIMAAYALVAGVVYIGTSLFSKSLGGWARTGHILLGLLYIAGGVIMMTNLGATAAVLAVFLSVTIGVLWILEGIMSFTLVKGSDSKSWTIIYGAISVIAGLVLVLSPLMGAVTLWLLLGISMVVMGLVQVVRVFQLGRK
ncbi:HdeD family acid-resistance protein [Leucobacter sp. HY1910]